MIVVNCPRCGAHLKQSGLWNDTRTRYKIVSLECSAKCGYRKEVQSPKKKEKYEAVPLIPESEIDDSAEIADWSGELLPKLF